MNNNYINTLIDRNTPFFNTVSPKQMKTFVSSDDFLDLEAINNLPRHNGILVPNNKQIITNKDVSNLKEAVFILGSRFHSKKFKGVDSICELATDRLYNEIGFTLPQSSILFNEQKTNQLFVISQDISESLPNLITRNRVELNVKGYYNIETFKWAILHDKNLKEEFLKFMTPECLEQYTALMLVDEVRTEKDRHNGNYFFYKRPNSEKFEGIIPIDNEQSQILQFPQIKNKDQFKYFINVPYHSETIFSTKDYFSYKTRLKQIKKLFDKGLLTEYQVNFLKDTLSIDYPKYLREACSNEFTKEYLDRVYTPMAYTWEEARQQFRQELEM